MYWCFLGPATVTGYVKPSIGLGVEAYLNTGKIAVSLYGSVAINSKLRIRVHRLYPLSYFIEYIYVKFSPDKDTCQVSRKNSIEIKIVKNDHEKVYYLK